MTTPNATFQSVNKENSKDILAAVLAMILKPFATDYIQIGKWYISAHACGYFLTAEAGYKFSFQKSQAPLIIDTLELILTGKLEFITYSSGSGIIYQNQQPYCYKFRNIESANDYFGRALIEHKANVVKHGTKSERNETKYVALVKAA